MKFKHIVFSILFTIWLAVCFSHVSAEDDDTEDKAIEKKTSKPKISTGKRGDIPTLEEFEPSEEVSADKPISFPVDI